MVRFHTRGPNICTLCKIEQALENFAFKNKSLGVRCARCNTCRRQSQKKSYYKHHGTNLVRIRNQKKKNLSWFKKLKDGLVCSICGESSPECLDFHHLDQKDKEFEISSLRTRSKRTILKELSKCSCLCANCHRKFHAGNLSAELEPINLEIFAPVYPHATNV